MITIFCGPTLGQDEIKSIMPDCIVAPPAMSGEVYQAGAAGAIAIGLIDGYFHRVPAVLHKELLWALEQGVRVYGASSMGALRAAELRPWGMVGVGEIYERLASGIYADDDCVALQHALADDGYRALSVPLVNIVATVERACTSGVVSEEFGHAAIALARSTPYPDRAYRALLLDARASGLPTEQIEQFDSFVQRHAVDQKAMDARAMLHRMRNDLERETSSAAEPRVTGVEHTIVWRNTVRDWREHVRLVDTVWLTATDIAEECLIIPAPLQAALLRAAATTADAVYGVNPSARWRLAEVCLAAEDAAPLITRAEHKIIALSRPDSGQLDGTDGSCSIPIDHFLDIATRRGSDLALVLRIVQTNAQTLVRACQREYAYYSIEKYLAKPAREPGRSGGLQSS